MFGKDLDEFDLQVRSMMEDAEVKPSRRVWKAVSSRLDTDGSQASPWMWMRWAGAGLAALAAVVLGVFLIPGHNIDDPILTKTNIQSAGLLAQAAPAGPSEPVADVPVDVLPGAPAGFVPGRVTVLQEMPEETEGNVPSAEPVPAVEPEPVGQVSAPVSEEPVTVSEGPAVPEEDGYLPIEWADEPETKAKPVQVYAEGALLANDSDVRFGTGMAYRSSGVNVVRTGITELGESTYGIPFSAGLGVRFYVLPRFAVGTGLDYSLLARRFKGRYLSPEQKIDETGTVDHTMQYVGIPLNFSYDFVSKTRFKFYGYLGGEAEYAVSNKYRINGNTGSFDYSYAVKGLQWSVGAGLGVEFRFTDWLGAYIDPGFRYYFNCNQPTSVRTDKPLMFNFDLGLRFSF